MLWCPLPPFVFLQLWWWWAKKGMKTLISYGWCSSLRSDCSYSAGVKATAEQPSSAPFPLFYFVFLFVAHFSLVNLPYFLSTPLVFVLLFLPAFSPANHPLFVWLPLHLSPHHFCSFSLSLLSENAVCFSNVLHRGWRSNGGGRSLLYQPKKMNSAWKRCRFGVYFVIKPLDKL